MLLSSVQMKTKRDITAERDLFWIEVTDRNCGLTESAENLIRLRVGSALSRFRGVIRKVRVVVADQNGPKGGRDIRCNLQMKVDRWGEVFASAMHENAIGATARTVQKARRALLSRRGAKCASVLSR